MIKKKYVECGEVSIGLSLEISYQDDGERKHERVAFSTKPHTPEAPVCVIKEMADFRNGANAMLQKIKNLLANGREVEVTLSASSHESVPEHTREDMPGHSAKSEMIRFDSWFFKGDSLDCDPEEEGAGLYLQPSKNTEGYWDMVLEWNKDILASLAEAHL